MTSASSVPSSPCNYIQQSPQHTPSAQDLLSIRASALSPMQLLADATFNAFHHSVGNLNFSLFLFFFHEHRIFGKPPADMSLETTMLNGPSGQLELLSSLPPNLSNTKPPILFLHGSFCSAHCFQFLLPHLARHGYPSYAVSVRGHGASHPQSYFAKMFLTSIASWAADAQVALAHIAAQHPGTPPPVMGGHSLGGGVVQYMASTGLVHRSNPDASGRVSGLVLLSSAPLRNAGDIMHNWERTEAPNGYDYPWSERNVLHTTDQVRKVFFSGEAKEEVVARWIKECKTPVESARAGLSILWGYGEAGKVLDALEGVGEPERRRKVLCLVGRVDKLIPPYIMLSNAEAYEDAAGEEGEACRKVIIEGAAHHLMMDARWEECADVIVNWLVGNDIGVKKL